MGLGFVHVELLKDCSINFIQCLDQLKELLKINLLLRLTYPPEHFVNRLLIKHLMVLRPQGLDLRRVQDTGAVGKRHELS